MNTEQQRKMLECAAKACGIDGEYKTLNYFDGDDTGICSVNHPLWNPLTNPADTAEMCAELEISTNWYSLDGVGESLSVSVICSIGPLQNYEAYIKDHDNSRLKAWMFAATMYAAKIGGMKNDL